MTGRLLTARQVAERLGVSPETVLRWTTHAATCPASGSRAARSATGEAELDAWLERSATTGAADREVLATRAAAPTRETIPRYPRRCYLPRRPTRRQPRRTPRCQQCNAAACASSRPARWQLRYYDDDGEPAHRRRVPDQERGARALPGRDRAAPATASPRPKPRAHPLRPRRPVPGAARTGPLRRARSAPCASGSAAARRLRRRHPARARRDERRASRLPRHASRPGSRTT